MEVALLLDFIQILIALLFMMWVSIAVSFIYRKLRSKHLRLIEHTFAEVTSKYLYPSPTEVLDHIFLQRAFRKIGILPSRPRNVQYLIDLMVRTQRNLLGVNYKKLLKLYTQIPPYRASENKLESSKWYIKAKGIQEIYEMNQQQYLKRILREINHPNIFVRREAQIAIVVFLGWKSLRFLPYLKKEMTLWQQIKIVEKLFDLYPEPKIEQLRKIYYCKHPFAQGLIMRIIKKFNLEDETHFILDFVDSLNFKRRETAINCIDFFQLKPEQLAQLKLKFFQVITLEQQLRLLKYIARTDSTVDISFYKKILYGSVDLLKLSAAEVMWNNGFVEEVQDFYYKQYHQEMEKVG